MGIKQGKNYVCPLDDIILILKLRNGPDHYITLEGGFQFSSFGMPLKVLTSTALREKSVADFTFPSDYETINALGMSLNKMGDQNKWLLDFFFEKKMYTVESVLYDVCLTGQFLQKSV